MKLLMAIKRVINLFSWLLIALPIVIAATYSYRVSVDIPYYDEWTLVPLIEKWHDGNGSWQDLFQPYAAHGVSYVIPFGKAVALLGAKLTHWDIRFEIAVGFFMILATAYVFIKYAQRIGCFTSNTSCITLLLPIMLMLFSLRQFESLIGPWGASFFGVAFFVMATAYLISQSSDNSSWLIGAMVCGVMASLTFPNGMIIWPLGLAALSVQNRWRQSAYWIFIGGIFFSIFFGFMYEYVPYDRSNVTFVLITLRFFGVLGGIFSMDKSIITAGGAGNSGQQDVVMAEIVGLAIFSISCFLLWVIRKELRNYLVPLMGLLYSLGSCVMIAYGRADFGLGQAFASRYTTESLLLVVSLLIIIAQLRMKGVRFVYLEYGLIGLIVISSVYATLTEMTMLPYRHSYLQSWADKVLNYHNAGSDLKNPHFTEEQMRAYIATLDRMKMSVFREQPIDLSIPNWGPQSVEIGTIPNKQPDGTMGIWIEVSNTQGLGDAQVIFDGKTAKSTSVQDKLITVAITPDQLKTSGNKQIYIKQTSTGRLFNVGTFIVNPKKP